jgi:hypothetical protein
MVFPFFSPLGLILRLQVCPGLEEAKSLAGKVLRLIQIFFADFAKNPASLSSSSPGRFTTVVIKPSEKRFVVRADEKLTAFIELETAVILQS